MKKRKKKVWKGSMCHKREGSNKKERRKYKIKDEENNKKVQ